MGCMVALGTAAASQGADDHAPLPCMHMGNAQLLPQLTLQGPVATTTGEAAGKFVLRAQPVLPGGRRPQAELASALRCRSHGRLAGLAVSTLRPGRSSAASSASEGGPEEDDASLAPEEPAAALAPAVLEAWSPQAGQCDSWGLYEFEVASGALAARPLLLQACSAALPSAAACPATPAVGHKQSLPAPSRPPKRRLAAERGGACAGAA